MWKCVTVLAIFCTNFVRAAPSDGFEMGNELIAISLNYPINEFPGLFRNKCIEDLGCFYTGPPFFHPVHRPISLPPQDILQTEFLLFSRSNANSPQVLRPQTESLETSSLDPSLDTKFLIHGYLNQLPPDDSLFQIKDELLKLCACNVVVVNWTTSNQFLYPQAVANARVVGAQVAKFIDFHMDKMGLDPKSVHLIGHSLGSQMTGWIGERINPKVSRISGLDPAGPWFQHAESTVRLDPTDADFVDVIHTNGGDNPVTGLGIEDPVGHIDFYPNGGNSQPGCLFRALKQTNGEMNQTTKLIANSCDHSRSQKLFLSSISECQFVGVECDNYRDFRSGECTPGKSASAVMGYHATHVPTLSGDSTYFLDTSAEAPFCDSNDVE